MIQLITVIGYILISQVIALQFGFNVSDGNNMLKKRFVAFGMIPENTSSKIQSEVVDQLKEFIDEELHRRNIEGIDRTSFIADPVMLSALEDGKVLIGLKGELSVFLNIFRFSRRNILPVQNIWKEAIFFSDPILTLNFQDLDKFLKEFEVIVIEASIADEDESVYSDIFRRFTSSNASESEEIALIPNEVEDPSNRCCPGYCCNIM